MNKLNGFWVAAVTPFDADNRFNPAVLHRLMDKTLAEGASGFLIGGSSAECPMLTHEERIAGLEAAAGYAHRSATKLMGSVAAMATYEAVEYAKTAELLGYDAMISTVPYYYKFSMKQIADYMRALRSAADLPLYLYNFPGNTGVEINLNDPDIRAMLKDGTVDGVKQTSLNLHQIERIKSINPDLTVFGGFDEVYLGARILGADGAIGSTFNFTLPLFTRMEAAYQARDIEAAQALQRRANNIMDALVSCSLFPSIKHILMTQGLDCGVCRAPFPMLTDAQKALIERVVAENL